MSTNATSSTAAHQHTDAPFLSPADALRAAMRGRCVGLPGAFNGLVARQVRDKGFAGAYVSGAAVTASFGVPDVGLLTLNEFCHVIRQVWLGSRLPIIADADTGFGEAEMVRRVVHEYHNAGAAGLHIEDQVFPKRCGHLDGKQLVPVDHFVEKVRAASDARDALRVSQSERTTEGKPTHTDSNTKPTDADLNTKPSGDHVGRSERGPFIVCARTDAFGVSGMDDALARARACVEAGADMIFPEGLSSPDAFERFARAMQDMGDLGLSAHGGPFLLANMTEFGKTPITPLARFERMGYSCVIWPVSTLRSAMGASERLLDALAEDGHVERELDAMLTRDELYALLGYTPGEEWSWLA